MSITYEGTVENGQIRLPPHVHLPEHTRVLIIVPNTPPQPRAHILSPRLAHPEQITDFDLEVIEEHSDDAV